MPIALQLIGTLLSTVLLLSSPITVHRSANCECCTAWEAHLTAAGFSVTDAVHEDMAAVKTEHGIAAELESCHTAVVDGYVIEGHVPARSIQRLLKQRPALRGLSAPGMPMGSPGMDGEGIDAEAFAVLSLDDDGTTQVFDRYGS
ncbi:MAG: hypothetical protein CMN97_07415 [Synechococcus sp. NAT40]|nr:hypothetical protein [Synechococcus sp. NAT40]